MSEINETTSPLRVSARPSARITKSDRTRAAILNAALDFLWSHPFREMSIPLLMKSAGASRSTFYQYFDDRQAVMESLLSLLEDEVYEGIKPWLVETGDPVVLMRKTLTGLVDVCYKRGPFLRAIIDAAATEQRLEEAWQNFAAGFDRACTARIEADQTQGLIVDFEAYPVAYALNRMDAYTLMQAFGRRPRKRPEPVRKALIRIWTSTLYGIEWLEKDASNLIRT